MEPSLRLNIKMGRPSPSGQTLQSYKSTNEYLPVRHNNIISEWQRI